MSVIQKGKKNPSHYYPFSKQKLVLIHYSISPTPFLVRRQGRTRMPLPLRPWLYAGYRATTHLGVQEDCVDGLDLSISRH